MKKMILALTALFVLATTANAMSYEQARTQALFLTDKMAYELNLTEQQYEAAYEVNLDYLMSVNTYDDLYGAYWTHRNLDLSYILFDWQYRAFCAATYFYRPLYWDAGIWHFAIYARYPHRNYFYFGRPHFWHVYRGGHSWHHNGGRSWYHGRDFGHRGITGSHNHHFGMRDGFKRGDYRNGYGNGRSNQGHGRDGGFNGNNRDNRGGRYGNGGGYNDNNRSGHGGRDGGFSSNRDGRQGNGEGFNGNGNGRGGRVDNGGSHEPQGSGPASIGRRNTNTSFNTNRTGVRRESSTRATVTPNGSTSRYSGSGSFGSRRESSSYSRSNSSSSYGRDRGSRFSGSSSSRFGGSMQRSSGSSFGGSRGGGSFGGSRSMGGGSRGSFGGGHRGGRR